MESRVEKRKKKNCLIHSRANSPNKSPDRTPSQSERERRNQYEINERSYYNVETLRQSVSQKR